MNIMKDTNMGDEQQRKIFKQLDMTDEMKWHAYQIAQKALQKYSIERDIAEYIKLEFDNEYGENWHCIAGKSFGSFVTHESKHYVYFYIGEVSFLLYKFG